MTPLPSYHSSMLQVLTWGNADVEACCPKPQPTLATEVLDLQASHSAFCALLVDGAGGSCFRM